MLRPKQSAPNDPESVNMHNVPRISYNVVGIYTRNDNEKTEAYSTS